MSGEGLWQPGSHNIRTLGDRRRIQGLAYVISEGHVHMTGAGCTSLVKRSLFFKGG
jgi:hypothetical protein